MKRLLIVVFLSLILICGCSNKNIEEQIDYKEKYEMLSISHSELKKENDKLKEEIKANQDIINKLTTKNETSEKIIDELNNRYISALNYINVAEYALEQAGIKFYYIREE